MPLSGMADSWKLWYFLKFCCLNTRYNPLTLANSATQIGLIAAEGLYSSGKSAVIISGLLRLWRFPMCCFYWLHFFYQPGDFVSRSTYFVLAVERISCLCQICVDTTIKHLRKQGAVRGSTLICRSEDREKSCQITGKENCYNLLGWADVNSLAEDLDSLDAT